MGSLFVIAGPPGPGKSTVARLLIDRAEHSVLVEGHAFFRFLASGAIEPWLAAADEQIGVTVRAAAAAAGGFASGSYTTIYDGVVGPWSL